MLSSKNLSSVRFYLFILLMITNIFSQETGIVKSLVDSKTGITFNTFRSDSTETVFYEVKIDGGLVYDSPKNNAELVYSMDKNSIVEFLEVGPKKNFVKIRLVDTPGNFVEGWVRNNTLSKTKLYGRSFIAFSKESGEKKMIEKLFNPNWINMTGQKLYFGENLQENACIIMNKGDVVYIDSLANGIAKVKYLKSGGVYSTGYIKTEALSSLAVIDSSRTDFDDLYNMIDPLVLAHDLNKSGFISFTGMIISDEIQKSINEDKICREVGQDSLMYKFTYSENVNDIKKIFIRKSDKPELRYAMYRILPDENIITRADTIKCKVIEIVHTPKSASISLKNIEETEITNEISKFYVHHLDNFDMDIVFQKETNEYFWAYKKDLATGEYLEKNYKPTKVVKRVTAFKKYDLEK
ncbi:MAG: hypothetical protein JXR69_02385 [Candidatus Delongbacteria bacterium]|nr:hypothetical protein [Candidatus Delongbacteria bacterium]